MKRNKSKRGTKVVVTESCTGCFEPGDYMGLAHNYKYDEEAKCHLGVGCNECGYQGKRRNTYFIPDSFDCEL